MEDTEIRYSVEQKYTGINQFRLEDLLHRQIFKGILQDEEVIGVRIGDEVIILSQLYVLNVYEEHYISNPIYYKEIHISLIEGD